MEIEPINNKVIGEIKLNYYILVSSSSKITTANIKQKVSKLLKGILYEYSLLSFNIDKNDGNYSYNLLIKTNETDLSQRLYNNISGKGKIDKIDSKILIRVNKPIKKGINEPEHKEQFKTITGENFVGKRMNIRIIPITDKESTMYFICRYITGTNNHTSFISPLTIG
jgi:hypothetical protein